MEGLGINLTLLVAQIFNFIILFLILSAVAYKPMVKFLDGRREKIAKGLEDARKAEERLANIEKDYQMRMDAARADAQKMVADLTANAEKNAGAIVAKANEDAAKIKVTAQEEAETERNKALSDLRSQVVTLSMAAANKLIGASMDEKRQRSLVNEFFSGVRDGKIVLLEPGAKWKALRPRSLRRCRWRWMSRSPSVPIWLGAEPPMWTSRSIPGFWVAWWCAWAIAWWTLRYQVNWSRSSKAWRAAGRWFSCWLNAGIVTDSGGFILFWAEARR